MTLLRAGEPIVDAVQVMDVFMIQSEGEPASMEWIFMICEVGPRAHTIAVVHDAPFEGLEDCVATLREAAARFPVPVVGVYASHHNHGILTFPEYISLEEGT